MVDDKFFERNKGLKDSKDLTDKQIKEAFERVSKDKMTYIIWQIMPDDIEDNNINLLEMNELIRNLLEFRRLNKELPDKIFINNWEYSVGNFRRRFDWAWNYLEETRSEKEMDISNWSITHKSLDEAVYLASIIARYHELKYKEDLRHKLNEDFGSGNPNDKRTIAFLRRHINNLPKFVKRSYITVRRLIAEEVNNDKDETIQN